jgi:hypothetical protein
VVRSGGGGGPSINSPEQMIAVLVLVAIVAVVWLWKFAD